MRIANLRLTVIGTQARALVFLALVAFGCGGTPTTPTVAVAVVEVSLAPGDRIVVPLGATLQLIAVALSASGDTLGGRTIDWSSSDDAILSVDAAGRVRGEAPGSAVITATVEMVRGSIDLGVPTSPTRASIVDVAIPGRPHGVAAREIGFFAVSLISGSAVRLGELDGGTQTVGDPITVGSAPAHVAANPVRDEVYTTNQFGSSVSVVDIGSGSTVATIPLSDGGFNLVVSPDGDRLYATTANGVLHVIDTDARAVIATRSVGAAANGLAVHGPSNRLYVSSRDANTVTVIDMATNDVVDTFPVGGQPQRIAVNASGETLYVATEDVGLQIVDTETGDSEFVGAVATGAVGLALTPDETQVYVTNPPGGFVQVVSLETRSVVATLQFLTPRNVTFNAIGTVGIVADEANRVWFIR